MSADAGIVIVGAGISGLTLAYRLTSMGKRVVVLEREPVAGGLARSYRYGDYQFDVGPHRFYTEEAEVTAFISEILGEDTLIIPRSSAVFMDGRFVEWPLKPSALFAIKPGLLLKALRDLLLKEEVDGGAFDDYIISRYGRTLYEIFFRPYTEKFLGIKCSDIAREWAVAGIDRATIDSKAGTSNLLALAGSLLNRRDPLQFIYPRSGAISVFADNLVERIRSKGGRVLLSCDVLGLKQQYGLVTAVCTGNDNFPCTDVIWTASQNTLATCLACEPPSLEYLSLLLYNYRLSTPCTVPYQWCYFGEGDIPFNRISFPTLFNERLAPAGCSGLSVEVTCRKSDPIWSDGMAHEKGVRSVLLQYGLIPAPDAIVGVSVERVPEAYPVYRSGFQEQVSSFRQRVPVSNLITAGRSGGFWYNNMDNSISEALRIAAKWRTKAEESV